MEATIYTAGYHVLGRPLALKALAEKMDLIVIDVRFHPDGARGWSRQELSALLGERYRWVQELGNSTYKQDSQVVTSRRQFRIHDLETGLEILDELIAEGRRPLLLCTCATPAECHRSVIAEASGYRVVHM